MHYRGYYAGITFDKSGRCYCGQVLGTRRRLSFRGRNMLELEQNFREAVDAYLDACQEWGFIPDRAYGAPSLRAAREARQKAAAEAARCRRELKDPAGSKLAV